MTSRAAILTFPGATPLAAPRRSRYEQGQTHYWRNQYNGQLWADRQRSCRMCRGTGEITVDDGAGGVEYDDCPRCQRGKPNPNFDPNECAF